MMKLCLCTRIAVCEPSCTSRSRKELCCTLAHPEPSVPLVVLEDLVLPRWPRPIIKRDLFGELLQSPTVSPTQRFEPDLGTEQHPHPLLLCITEQIHRAKEVELPLRDRQRAPLIPEIWLEPTRARGPHLRQIRLHPLHHDPFPLLVPNRRFRPEAKVLAILTGRHKYDLPILRVDEVEIGFVREEPGAGRGGGEEEGPGATEERDSRKGCQSGLRGEA